MNSHFLAISICYRRPLLSLTEKQLLPRYCFNEERGTCPSYPHHYPTYLSSLRSRQRYNNLNNATEWLRMVNKRVCAKQTFHGHVNQ